MSHENELLINTNYKYKRENCLLGMSYIVYFLYHILLFGMVSFNTYYTVNMAHDISNDTHEINDELNMILDTINKYLNGTIS
tara:strand:+ start:214 stop:459 length:246 start_codon:yes stop_codon:yes gene_type:complete